jgi:hypothetical protein
MNQLALFGNAVDRFLLAGELPDEADEEAVTEAIYSVAVNLRSCEPERHDYYDYKPPQEQEAEELIAMGTPEYIEGMRVGNKGDSAIRCPYKVGSLARAEWMAGHTIGTRMFRESRATEAVCETPLMRRGSDCRVIRGRAEY